MSNIFYKTFNTNLPLDGPRANVNSEFGTVST